MTWIVCGWLAAAAGTGVAAGTVVVGVGVGVAMRVVVGVTVAGSVCDTLAALPQAASVSPSVASPVRSMDARLVRIGWMAVIPCLLPAPRTGGPIV